MLPSTVVTSCRQPPASTHARTVRPSSQWLYRCNASATRLRPSCNFPATFARPPFDARKLHDRTWVVRRSNLSRVAVITAAQRDNSLVHHRPLERRPVPRGKFPAVFSAVIRRKPTAEGKKCAGYPLERLDVKNSGGGGTAGEGKIVNRMG